MTRINQRAADVPGGRRPLRRARDSEQRALSPTDRCQLDAKSGTGLLVIRREVLACSPESMPS